MWSMTDDRCHTKCEICQQNLKGILIVLSVNNTSQQSPTICFIISLLDYFILACVFKLQRHEYTANLEYRISLSFNLSSILFSCHTANWSVIEFIHSRKSEDRIILRIIFQSALWQIKKFWCTFVLAIFL